MAKKESAKRGLTAESVLNNLQYIEGIGNQLQYLDNLSRNGKFKKGEEESARKSILLAESKILMRGRRHPGTFTYENWKKSGKGLDQLQNELVKRAKKNRHYHAGSSLMGGPITGDYANDALNLAIERGDIDLAVKLYGKCPVEFFAGDKDGSEAKFSYFVGLGNVYNALGQFGSAKEQYIKARNIAKGGDDEATYEGRRGYKAFTPDAIRNEVGNTIGKMIREADSKMKKSILERRVSSVIAIAGLGAGIFFLQSNITGNAIADLSTNTTSWVGGVLLVVGLVAGFFWIRSKKKNQVVKKKK
jgi:tetratricopeptide (TPR) repeat protein